MAMQDRPATANATTSPLGDASGRRIHIEDIYPTVDGGRFPVKRVVGETVEVWADVFRDGHAVLAAELLWRPQTSDPWLRVPMRPYENDRWTASFTPPSAGRYLYAIEAWTDLFATWRRDFLVKRQAGLDVKLEVEEGRKLLALLKPRSDAHSRLLRDLGRLPGLAEDPTPLLSEKLATVTGKDLR